MVKSLRLPLVSQKSSRLERERLNSLINSMADGVIAVDENLKVAITNGAALNILDVNTTLVGRFVDRVLHLIDKNNQPIDLTLLIKSISGSFASREIKMVYPDGENVNIYLSIAPVKLGYRQKGHKGYVFLIRDITKEKSLEDEREEFVSVVSHELRTPITIAEGNLSNAKLIFEKSRIKNESITRALNDAHSQINFLADLINDLSMLSRAEHGQLAIDIESINVHDLIVEMEKSYEPEAGLKDLQLGVDIDPNLELLQSGRLYVKEILQNFITNAIKYTTHGQVTIGAKKKERGIEFYVSDTGNGISKSDQLKIFDKFYRAENFQTRETSGTGLGLYVTMKLARLLHADIKVESEIGKGSTFTIYVPNLR